MPARTSTGTPSPCPAGQNTLTLHGRAAPHAWASAWCCRTPRGGSVPMSFEPGDCTGHRRRTAATVTPGASYRVRVQQPPFSAVFTFDTSGSMGNYLGVRVRGDAQPFSAGVVPGGEAVQIVPFEEEPLLPEWSDEPVRAPGRHRGRRWIGAARARLRRPLINATDAAGEAGEGAKAVLTGHGRRDLVLRPDGRAVGHARRRAAAGLRGPRRRRHARRRSRSTYMQDWAASSGRLLPVHAHARGDGPRLRPHGHLAASGRPPTRLSYQAHVREAAGHHRPAGHVSTVRVPTTAMARQRAGPAGRRGASS